jgi:hypothetical protein
VDDGNLALDDVWMIMRILLWMMCGLCVDDDVNLALFDVWVVMLRILLWNMCG